MMSQSPTGKTQNTAGRTMYWLYGVLQGMSFVLLKFVIRRTTGSKEDGWWW